MARVLIIGASRGIGLEACRQALDAGHSVRAMARSADEIRISSPRLERIRGDALNSADVQSAVEGVDAVIQSLGVNVSALIGPVSLFSEATRALIAAMTSADAKRLICVTGFGAGESRARMGLMQLIPFELIFGRVYDDKTLQERLIKRSALDWTIARPGVLTRGPRTGRYKILVAPSEWRNGTISRADVAEFLVRQIEDRSCLCKAPVLVY
jgi:putative NADH-flavin reductase